MSASSERKIGIGSLGSIGDVKLSQVPKLEDCKPGFIPTEYNVVVAPAVIGKKIGAILIADETRERVADGAQVGRIIACSPVAFNYERWPEDAGPPQVGDIVWFARFAGASFEGIDGETYRIIKDKDIAGIIPEENA